MNKNLKCKKSFRKGDILLCEEPFVFVLKSKYRKDRCDNCLKRAQVLKKCSGCSYVHYCDRACQRNAWSLHKFECHNLKRVHPRILPDAARMLARLVIKLNKGGANEKSYYTESKFRCFKDLLSHYNEIKKDERRIQHFMSLNAVLHEYLTDQLIPNTAELLSIYGKMVINTFNILDSEMQSIGSGLYLAASVIDHSCSPNAVAVFEETKIFIRTLDDLSNLNWMNVFICYIELLNLPSVRQKELQSLYYFLCECSRCLSIDEFKYMTSSICQNDDCGECIMGNIEDSVTKCSKCGQIVTQETKDKIEEITQFTIDQLQKMEDLAYLDICKICLQKQKKFFHSLNIYNVKILDLAMESCIALENWQGALHYGQKLLKPFREYYGNQHPLRGIFLMKLGKIALLLEMLTEAKQYFAEAESILSITHGRNHPLVKEELHSYMQQCQM